MAPASRSSGSGRVMLFIMFLLACLAALGVALWWFVLKPAIKPAQPVLSGNAPLGMNVQTTSTSPASVSDATSSLMQAPVMPAPTFTVPADVSNVTSSAASAASSSMPVTTPPLGTNIPLPNTAGASASSSNAGSVAPTSSASTLPLQPLVSMQPVLTATLPSGSSPDVVVYDSSSESVYVPARK